MLKATLHGVGFVRRLKILALGTVLMGTLAVISPPTPATGQLVASDGDVIATWAGTQVGYTCAHYGWCQASWCAKFASRAWDAGGGSMPSYWAVGDIYNWAVANGQWRGGYGAYHHPGDLVLYKNTSGGWAHVGVIRDGIGYGGSIRTVEGNYSSKVSLVGYFAVSNPGGWEPGYHIAGYVVTLSA